MRANLLVAAALVVATEAFSQAPRVAPACRLHHPTAACAPRGQLASRRPPAAARAVRMGIPGFPLGGGGGLFNVGTPEFVVIAALAWVLLGPKELLRLSREAGELIGNLRKLGTEAADQFKEAIESEISLDEIEQERRAIEQSMSQIRTGARPPTPADDMFGSAFDDEVAAPKPSPKRK